MKELKHSDYDLKQMQSLPLSQKINMTNRRIKEWYEYWDGKVYVSFSGGKDSTVLLHLVRNLYPDVVAVFSDTGLEYPEIREFVKQHDNVTIIKPKKTFKQVVLEFGYPVATKEVAQKIYYYLKGADWAKKYVDGSAIDADGNPSRYRIPDKWKSLIDAPFKVSNYCCKVMKKDPFDKFERKSKLHPITGMLASESKLREQSWKKTGCNSFDSYHPHSNPMAFWTENDILQYIYI